MGGSWRAGGGGGGGGKRGVFVLGGRKKTSWVCRVGLTGGWDFANSTQSERTSDEWLQASHLNGLVNKFGLKE